MDKIHERLELDRDYHSVCISHHPGGHLSYLYSCLLILSISSSLLVPGIHSLSRKYTQVTIPILYLGFGPKPAPLSSIYNTHKSDQETASRGYIPLTLIFRLVLSSSKDQSSLAMSGVRGAIVDVLLSSISAGLGVFMIVSCTTIVFFAVVCRRGCDAWKS